MNQSDPNQTTTAMPVDELINSLCATIPDYPKPGISFKDLTPVFADGAALGPSSMPWWDLSRASSTPSPEWRPAASCSRRPPPTPPGPGSSRSARPASCRARSFSEDYALEYGTATLELHTTDLAPGSRVLILDDVLATGGTLGAAARLFERCGIHVAGIGVVMELDDLGGRTALTGHNVRSLLRI